MVGNVKHTVLACTSAIDYRVLSPYFKGDYGVVITGPSAAVKDGDLVQLNCTVTAVEPLPSFLTVTTSSQYSINYRKVVDIILPTGEKRKGMQMLQRRVRLSDDGQFTCEAHWNDPNHTEKDMYRLNITGDFLLSVYIVKI